MARWTKEGAVATMQYLREQLDDREAEVERLREALELSVDAITYAREPHHLDHREECSLCEVATDHLDLALGKAHEALNGKESP